MTSNPHSISRRIARSREGREGFTLMVVLMLLVLFGACVVLLTRAIHSDAIQTSNVISHAQPDALNTVGLVYLRTMLESQQVVHPLTRVVKLPPELIQQNYHLVVILKPDGANHLKAAIRVTRPVPGLLPQQQIENIWLKRNSHAKSSWRVIRVDSPIQSE